MQGDEKVIKTAVRANPGIVLMQNGVILGKWSQAEVPSMAEIDELIQ